MKRFIAVQEPCCTWAVFDTVDEAPAEFGGMVLIGLGKAEAAKLASLANAEPMPRSGDRWIAGAGLRLVTARAA